MLWHSVESPLMTYNTAILNLSAMAPGVLSDPLKGAAKWEEISKVRGNK